MATETLTGAVERAGYAVPHDGTDLRIEGMTCASCVARASSVRCRRCRACSRRTSTSPPSRRTWSASRCAGAAALMAAVAEGRLRGASWWRPTSPRRRARPRATAGRSSLAALLAAAGAAHAGRSGRQALDAVASGAVDAGHAGAVLARRALLPRRLEALTPPAAATWICWSRWAPAPPTASACGCGGATRAACRTSISNRPRW